MSGEIPGYTEIFETGQYKVMFTRGRTNQVVPNKKRTSITWHMRQTEQHYHADDRWDAQECNDRALLLGVRRKCSTSHGGDDLHSTKWNVQQDCLELIESKGVDD